MTPLPVAIDCEDEMEGIRRTHPPASAWMRIATEEAIRSGLRPADVLGGTHRRPVAYARWRAWRALKEAYPKASLLGIGTVSGFDHTGVRYGLMRLAGLNPKKKRPNKIAQFLPRPLQATGPTA